MNYDFTTAHARYNMEAAKWDSMGIQEPGIVPLSVADMELLSPPEIIDELKKTAEFGMWGYTSWGERYGSAVCHWMKTRHNWEIDPSWIVQTNGVVQALQAAVRAFSDPGDEVLLLTPVYYPFYRAVRMNGRRVLESPLRLADGRYEIDFEDLEEKAKRARMLLLCSPHNPLGRVWTREELRRIGDICLKHDVLVVSDEIHFDVIMPGYVHTVFASLGPEYAQRCIVCTAPSKTFSLAALCVANILIPNEELRERFSEEIRRSGCYTYSIFGMRALETGYMQCGDWVDQMCAHVYGNYQCLKDFMAEYFPNVWVAVLEGTYLCWFDCRSFGMKGKELENYLHEEARLFLDEGYIFGPAGDGFERLNLACTRKTLTDALERFRKAFARIA